MFSLAPDDRHAFGSPERPAGRALVDALAGVAAASAALSGFSPENCPPSPPTSGGARFPPGLGGQGGGISVVPAFTAADSLRAWAAGAELTPVLCDAVVMAVRAAYPHCALLARRCIEELLAQLAPLEAPSHANAWLCLGQIHAFRREGAEAAAAADRARALFAAQGDLLGVARCDLVAGAAALAQGHHADALALLAQARTVCEAAGDRASQVEALLESAHCHAEQSQFATAMQSVDTAARLVGDDPWQGCRIEIQRADTWFSQTRYPEAAAAYATLAERCARAGWRLDVAHVRVMQGLLATQQGACADAERHLLAATQTYLAEESAYYVAVCRRGLASLYWRTGRYPEAQVAAEAARATFAALGHTVAVGRCNHALGLINQAWNRYDAALAAYDQALVCFAAAHLPHEQLTVLKNQAIIQEARGYYHAALAIYERVLAGSRELGLVFLESSTLDTMAMLHGRLGQYAEAVALYQQCRRACRRSQAEFDAQVAAAQQAGILLLLGRKESARRLLGRARRYFRAQGRAGPLAFCELTAGEIAAAAGKSQIALRHYRLALAHFTDTGQRVDAALCRLDMGEASLAAGDSAGAVQQLTATLAVLAPDFPDVAARAENLLGAAAAAQGHLHAAAAHWDRAVDHMTVARRGVVTERHAGGFFESHRRIYEDALDGWLAVDAPDAALQVVEASKGQVLASLLQQRDVVSAAFLAQAPEVQALWAQAWQVGRELDALRTRWSGPEAGGARSLTALAAAFETAPGDARARLTALADEQARLFERIRRAAASFDLLDPAAPFSLTRLRARAEATCGPGWGALAYYLRRDRLDTFWVTSQAVRAWRRPLSRLDLAKLRQAVAPDPDQRELLYAGRLRDEPQPAPPGPRILRDLARLLIPDEVRGELAAERTLLIAPHGLLHSLPFQALLLDDGRPLLEHATVSYAPTLHTWEGLAERRGVMANQPWQQALICGLGEFGGRAPALAYAEAEAHDLAERFGPRGRLILGQAVTHARLQAWSDDGTLAGCDVVHLATHASFDAAHPLQSRILLADGALTIPDLFRLRLNARLVTLSACQTALSALEPGDELLGLREALLFAGANALLVSLWAVDDASTGRLMALFYDRLLNGLAPAAALTAAQRHMRAAGESAFHWASFVVIG